MVLGGATYYIEVRLVSLFKEWSGSVGKQLCRLLRAFQVVNV
jgi:hypothetical protein